MHLIIIRYKLNSIIKLKLEKVNLEVREINWKLKNGKERLFKLRRNNKIKQKSKKKKLLNFYFKM